jgi:hypothetical protein
MAHTPDLSLAAWLIWTFRKLGTPFGPSSFISLSYAGD